VADIFMIVLGLMGALSNHGYRWGWYAIGCLFQIVIVMGLVLAGAHSRPAISNQAPPPGAHMLRCESAGAELAAACRHEERLPTQQLAGQAVRHAVHVHRRRLVRQTPFCARVLKGLGLPSQSSVCFPTRARRWCMSTKRACMTCCARPRLFALAGGQERA